MGKLAYLFPAFPVFHQTFVLWEVLGLHRQGVHPKIYSLKPGTPRQQPEAIAVAAEVTYLPRLRSAAVRRANLRLLLSRPWLYVSLYGEVFGAWRTGDVARSQEGWEPGRLSLRDRLRGWYNRQPFLYLLKSMLLVPHAVELAERLRAEQITHLHVHWATYPTTVAYVVKLITGIPFSFSAHAYDIYMVTRMLPAKVRAASFVATCARANAKFLRKVVGDKDAERIHVIYHGVDVDRFLPAASPPATGVGPLRIVSCGQLERYKGFHSLIDACARLRDQGSSVECRIVGEGPWRPQLEAQIESLGLKGSVFLTGALPHAAFAELLAAADVFALASELAGKSGRRDVIANVIVEAMSAGLPVVATRIPGADELVEDGVCGYLVTPNRVDELTEALARLVGSPEERRRLGTAARAKVLADFDSSKNVQEMARLLTAAAGLPDSVGPSGQVRRQAVAG